MSATDWIYGDRKEKFTSPEAERNKLLDEVEKMIIPFKVKLTNGEIYDFSELLKQQIKRLRC